jgi:hypothetical protein
MLEKNAPVLPVPGCDAGDCECRYKKFPDRRSVQERRVPFAQRQLLNFMSNKLIERQTADRRVRRQIARPRAYFNNYD